MKGAAHLTARGASATLGVAHTGLVATVLATEATEAVLVNCLTGADKKEIIFNIREVTFNRILSVATAADNASNKAKDLLAKAKLSHA